MRQRGDPGEIQGRSIDLGGSVFRSIGVREEWGDKDRGFGVQECQEWEKSGGPRIGVSSGE